MVNSWWVTTHHFEPELVKHDLQHMTDRMLVYSFATIQWESIKFDFNRMLVIAHLSCWVVTSHFIPWPTESGWQCVPFESSNHYYCNQQQVCGSAYISEAYVYSGLIIYASMICRKWVTFLLGEQSHHCNPLTHRKWATATCQSLPGCYNILWITDSEGAAQTFPKQFLTSNHQRVSRLQKTLITSCSIMNRK